MKKLLACLAAVCCLTIYAGAHSPPSGPTVWIASDKSSNDASGNRQLLGNVEIVIDGTRITAPSAVVVVKPSNEMEFQLANGTVRIQLSAVPKSAGIRY